MNLITPKIATAADSDYVLAQVNYTRRGGPKPAVYLYETPEPVPSIEERNEPHQIAIHDARPLLGDLWIDTQGFMAVRGHKTAIRNFTDPGELRTRYDGEVAELVTEATGARHALVFDHTIRRIGNNDRNAESRAPVHVAHNDYTKWSGPQRVRDLLSDEDAKRALKRRVAIVNVWRSISGPVTDTPLALADARTVADEDWIATDLKYPDRNGEVYRIAFNPAHRWYYVPDLQTDEVLLLKTYDSAKDGRARWAPHTAFDLPTTKPGTAKRQSIESRVLAFY